MAVTSALAFAAAGTALLLLPVGTPARRPADSPASHPPQTPARGAAVTQEARLLPPPVNGLPARRLPGLERVTRAAVPSLRPAVPSSRNIPRRTHGPVPGVPAARPELPPPAPSTKEAPRGKPAPRERTAPAAPPAQRPEGSGPDYCSRYPSPRREACRALLDHYFSR
ncbi:hypothetical protein [Sinosporangium album]|uniref:hypothetical protein n=1 Tax=Sinosporangium album TaxID=504805 RepID=UPI00115F83F5|nr:hypothetical protein [Sinosporangium album]